MDMPSPTLARFVQDRPCEIAHPERVVNGITIRGVVVDRLVANEDGRGALTELLTTRDGPVEPIVHVYQVLAEPGSVRGWVYHELQSDRLTFTMGEFEVRLVDIDPESPTQGARMTLRVGVGSPCRLTIPPLVAHVVSNVGETAALFVNLPTRAYDPARPDKFRYAGP